MPMLCPTLFLLPSSSASEYFVRRAYYHGLVTLLLLLLPLSLSLFYRLEMVTPTEYVGNLMELANNRRGEFVEMKYLTGESTAQRLASQQLHYTPNIRPAWPGYQAELVGHLRMHARLWVVGQTCCCCSAQT